MAIEIRNGKLYAEQEGQDLPSPLECMISRSAPAAMARARGVQLEQSWPASPKQS